MAGPILRAIILIELVLLAAGVVAAGITAGFWPAAVIAAFLAGGAALLVLGRSIPPGVHALVLGVFLLDAAGFAWGLFHALPPYDELAHFFSSMAVSITLAYLFYDSEAVVFRRRALFVLTVAGLTLGIGAMWELVEWLFDFIGSRRDTLTDLILDAVGALIGAGISSSLQRRQGGAALATGSSRPRRPSRSCRSAAAS